MIHPTHPTHPVHRRVSVGASLSASLTGLTAGIAVIGDHASVSAVMSDASTITAYAWGVSKADVDGTPSLGTGANPTDYAAGDGGSLWLKATAGGVDYYASAAIRYALAVNTVAPVVSGNTSLGDTLTTTNGTWTAAGGSYSYQWQRGGVDISGATASTYVIVAGDDAAAVRCVVTYTNSGGAVSANSNAVTVDDFAAPTVTGLPTIAGTTEKGATLTATAAAASGNPAPTRTWQWKRSGTPISGATSATYVLQAADVGETLTVVQTETNGIGADSAESVATATITLVAPVAGLALTDQLFQDNTGSKTYDVSGDFTGESLTFSLTTPITGVSINSTTGVVTFDTDAMALQFETSVAVKATNSGGDDTSGFSVTIGDVPSQMAAPAVSSAGDTSISVDRASAPVNNNAAITSYDLRWSTDETTWTTVTGITDPKTITGLTISTLYYVQTRAVNGFGAGAWSTSGSATTTGDATAPIISAATYDDVDTINITLDEGGTCYYMIDDNATRTAGQVETGGGEKSGSFTVTPPTDSEVVDFSSVTAGSHYLHIMVKDAAGNYSNVVSAQYTFVAADTTAPVLTSATDAKNGSTASTGSVSTDEGNGTLYWVVTTSATAPSKAQVKAGQDNSGTAAAYAGSQAVTATGVQNVTGTGLTASTAYTTHFMHEDAAANQSTVVSASGFTTDAADVTAPTFVSGAPADNSTDVAISQTFVLTFSETIVAPAAGGEFYLYATAGPTLIETFDVDAGTGDNGGTISVSGTGVTINPGANLTNSTAYSIRWNLGAVEDTSGNKLAANTGDTLYNITTIAAASGVTAATAASVVYNEQAYEGTTPITTSAYSCAGGANNCLVVAFTAISNETAPSIDPSATVVKYNGVPMTMATYWGHGGRDALISLFYLMDPPSGSHTFTWETNLLSRATIITAREYTGVNASTPIGQKSSANAATVTITPDNNNSFVFAATCGRNVYGGLTGTGDVSVLANTQTGTSRYIDAVTLVGEHDVNTAAALTMGVTDSLEQPTTSSMELVPA